MDEIIGPRKRLAMPKVSESVIVQDPEIHGGEPVFRGTRVPFQTFLDYLAGGETLDEFLEQYAKSNRVKDFLPLMPACADALRDLCDPEKWSRLDPFG